MIEFPVSGVEVQWWVPVVTAFCISALTSSGGVSGAFILLPFQMSVLGFTGPAVSATNMLYNVIAIPGGVYRYAREKRLVKPLVWATILGTLPGAFIGAVIRIKYLPKPGPFKFFVGLVLLYIGARLFKDIVKRHSVQRVDNSGKFEVDPLIFNLKSIGYAFRGHEYYASFPGIFILSLVVGVVGGIYGIGGFAGYHSKDAIIEVAWAAGSPVASMT